MTINASNLYLLDNITTLLDLPYNQINMCELGNEHLLLVDKLGKEYKWGIAKDYFKEKGIKHTSLDINGQDGVIKINLAKAIDTTNPELISKFDVVTNFGTSEHCSSQYNVFRNIHLLCKPNGIIIHSIPLDGYWKGHSPYRYKEEFITKLAKNNKYEIIYCKLIPRRKEKFLNTILRRKNNCFETPASFGMGITTQACRENRDNAAEAKFA